MLKFVLQNRILQPVNDEVKERQKERVEVNIEDLKTLCPTGNFLRAFMYQPVIPLLIMYRG